MGCEKCNLSVSYVVHESALARAERTIKRMWITCLVLITLLVVTNVMWIWYNSQVEYATTEACNEAHVEHTCRKYKTYNQPRKQGEKSPCFFARLFIIFLDFFKKVIDK